MPFRFLLDSRLFRLLCRGPEAVNRFCAALAHHRLAPEGSLPELEMTPLAILDVLGVEPPSFPGLPYLPKGMATLSASEVAIVLRETIQKEFAKAPQLEAASLKRRVDELRETTDPAARELFDVCLTRFVSREKLEEDILEQITFDALFTYRFPEEYRDRMNHFFNSVLLIHGANVAGLTKVRRLKTYWDTSLERILKRNPLERGEILAADPEMKPRTFKDFLAWEVIHHSVLGYARKRIHPVIAFSPDSEDRLRARCKIHKTAVRAFLDEIPRDELLGELQPHVRVWTPGWLMPCRADGTLGTPMLTGEVLPWAGSSPPAPLPRAGEG